jgi:hypothetical protein
LLMRKRGGIADQSLRETHRSRHLDTGLRACPHDRNAAADKECGGIDQHENYQKLCPQ